MGEQMKFPETWEEYEKDYGFNDSKEVYTNNSRLIPSFRVKQWLDYLKQEPFINKPCVSSGVCEHDKQKVLDKIKAEIKQLTNTIGGRSVFYQPYVNRMEVFEIIDKYMAERNNN